MQPLADFAELGRSWKLGARDLLRHARGPVPKLLPDELDGKWRRKPRHSPGTSGTCFPGAPDTIRTFDLCLSGLAPRSDSAQPRRPRSRRPKAIAALWSHAFRVAN